MTNCTNLPEAKLVYAGKMSRECNSSAQVIQTEKNDTGSLCQKDFVQIPRFYRRVGIGWI